MKITVIKKSSSNVNVLNVCPWVVDEPAIKNTK